MVIDTQTTLALYCQKCGSLITHDLSRFAVSKNLPKPLYCSCGHCQGSVVSVGVRQCLLQIPCVVCETDHLIAMENQHFWQDRVNKVYCVEENLELGFVGSRRALEEMLAAHKRELDNIFPETSYPDNEDAITNSQVMLEIINLVHDIAERGGIYCRCGGTAIEADILPDHVELLCGHCGGRQLIPALSESDVLDLKARDSIEIVPLRRSRRKH